VSRGADFEDGYAVVRIDPFPPGKTPDGDSVTLKEIWWTVEEAEAEVDRLNRLVDESETASRYFWQYTRVRRRS
jgi:hypothetical protein